MGGFISEKGGKHIPLDNSRKGGISSSQMHDKGSDVVEETFHEKDSEDIKKMQIENRIEQIEELERLGNIDAEMATLMKNLARMSDEELLQYHMKNPSTFVKQGLKPERGLVAMDDQGLEGQFVQKPNG